MPKNTKTEKYQNRKIPKPKKYQIEKYQIEKYQIKKVPNTHSWRTMLVDCNTSSEFPAALRTALKDGGIRPHRQLTNISDTRKVEYLIARVGRTLVPVLGDSVKYLAFKEVDGRVLEPNMLVSELDFVDNAIALEYFLTQYPLTLHPLTGTDHKNTRIDAMTSTTTAATTTTAAAAEIAAEAATAEAAAEVSVATTATEVGPEVGPEVVVNAGSCDLGITSEAEAASAEAAAAEAAKLAAAKLAAAKDAASEIPLATVWAAASETIASKAIAAEAAAAAADEAGSVVDDGSDEEEGASGSGEGADGEKGASGSTDEGIFFDVGMCSDGTGVLTPHPDLLSSDEESSAAGDADEEESAAGSDVDADADADDHTPAGVGGQKRKPKRKRKSRGTQKFNKKAAAQDGGYTDKGRMHFKGGGGLLVTGSTGARSCLPDSISMLLPSFSISVDPKEMRSIMPNDPTKNTLFSDADLYLEKHGLTLLRCTQRFTVKGGPALALLRTKGTFVVQLTITTGKEDKNPDLHCVAYDGKTVRDNYKYSKVKELDGSDSDNFEAARQVFDSLFQPGLQVRIKNVYELKRI